MDNYNYFSLVLNNMGYYAVSVLLTVILIYFPKRVRESSVIDPVFLNSMYFAFAISVCLFLYLINEINEYYFIKYYFLSIIGFYLFLTFSKYKIARICKISCNDLLVHKLSVFLFITLTLVSYIRFGVPIFSDDRLGSFVDSGGFGIIPRINSGLYFIILFGSLNVLVKNYRTHSRIQIFHVVSLVVLVLSGILTGARSWMLNLAMGGFLYFLLFEAKVIRISVRTSILVLFIVFLSFIGSAGGDIYNLINSVFYRLALNGDAFFMALPNDVIDVIQTNNPWSHLFSVFLVPLRLMSQSADLFPMGVLLAKYHYPSLDGFFGPNSSPAIYANFLFSDFFFIFLIVNYVVGGFLAFVLAALMNRTLVGAVLSAKLYLIGIAFLVDTSFALSSIFDLIILVVIIVLFKITTLGLRKLSAT